MAHDVIIRSQYELADHFEVSQKTASLWVRRDDWPVRRRAPWGPVDLRKIDTWRQGLSDGGLQDSNEHFEGGGPQTSDGDGLPTENVAVTHKKVQTLLAKEKLLDARLSRQVKEGKLVPRDLLDGALGGLVAMFKEGLEDLEMSLPERLESLPSTEIQKIMARHIDGLLKRLIERAEYDTKHVADVAKEIAKRGAGRPRTGERAIAQHG